jgi:hypothetical protein
VIYCILSLYYTGSVLCKYLATYEEAGGCARTISWGTFPGPSKETGSQVFDQHSGDAHSEYSASAAAAAGAAGTGSQAGDNNTMPNDAMSVSMQIMLSYFSSRLLWAWAHAVKSLGWDAAWGTSEAIACSMRLLGRLIVPIVSSYVVRIVGYVLLNEHSVDLRSKLYQCCHSILHYFYLFS